MTERSYPFVGGTTTDAEFSAMFRQVFPASVIDGLAVSADSSGLQVKLPAGSGFVRGHYYKNSADILLPIEPGASNPRIDTVVLRLEYGTANSITAKVVKGTASASPTRPALVQTDTGVFEFPLADVPVASGAVTIPAGDVIDRRLMYADALKELLDVYDTVPVSRGGTGAISASGARTNLGLADTKAAVDNASASSTADPLTLVKRDGSGMFGVPTPTSDTHPANKAYVDAVGTTSGDSNTIMRRNSDGQTGVGYPTAGSHAASKQYVDNVDANNRTYTEGRVADLKTYADNKVTGLTGVSNNFEFGRSVQIQNNLTMGGHVYVPNATAVSSGYVSAWINSDGRLGKSASSERFKKYISDQDPYGMGDLFPQLKRFQLKGGDGSWRYGYIAERLAEVPDQERFVVYESEVDENGKATAKLDENGQPIPESIDFFGMLIAQTAQLHQRALAADERATSAEARLDALEQRLAALEA